MAINLPRSLYTAGAERFNSQPVVNLYANLLARRRAREDALNQYYQKLHTSINPAGMRVQDIEGGFAQKVQDWQQHYFENKNAIQNPRTPADRTISNEHASRYEDLLMDIQKSKDAAKQELQLATAKIAGKWNPTEEDMQVAHAIGSSIYSNDYYKDPEVKTQPYTINDVSLNVPEFTPLQEQQLYKSASQGLSPKNKIPNLTKQRRDTTTGYVYTPYQEKFTPEQIQTIADNYGNNLTKSARVHFENLMQDQDAYTTASKAYQQVYGQDQIIDTPEKMAKATAALHAMADVRSGEDKALNRDQLMSEWQRKEAIRQANREQLLRLRPAISRADKAANELWIDNYIDKLVKDQSPDASEYHFLREGIKYEHKVPIDPVMSKALTKDGQSPDLLTVTADGKLRPIYYKYDPKTHNPIKDKNGRFAINDVASVPISTESLKLALGKTSAGVKQTNVEMTAPQKSNSYLIKGKKYSEQELIKMGYTKDQIAPYKQK